MGGPLLFKYNDGKTEAIEETDNFSKKYPFNWNFKPWLAVEQAYQAAKIPETHPDFQKIRDSENYSDWIQIGGWFSGLDLEDWNKRKKGIMKNIVEHKVKHNKSIIKKLKELKGKGKFYYADWCDSESWDYINANIWNDIMNNNVEWHHNVIGKESYNIYADSVDWKSFNGDNLKNFEELPDNIKNAWKNVENHCKL
jgi:hypothetical protein